MVTAKRRIVVILAAAILMVCGSATHARLITFEYGGVVDTVNDPSDLLAGVVQEGDSFSGTFTFESTTPDSYPADPKFGLYRLGPGASRLTIGSLALDSTSGGDDIIAIQNDFLVGLVGDVFLMGGNGYESGGFEILEFAVTLGDTSGSVFDSDALPSTALDFDAFDSAKLHLLAEAGGARFEVFGTVTHVIPEPGTLGLLLTGIVLAPCLRRRWAKRSH